MHESRSTIESTEQPLTFVRREATTIAACAIAFVGILLYVIYSTDPSYYYPRLVTDQLLYYLKGLSLVEHGTTAARVALNARPFSYAAMPGILRAPFIALFDEFDDQLRAIQISNVLLAVALAVMTAYVISTVLPRRLHRAAIAGSFALLLLNPVWVANLLSPLADLPYAAAALGALLLLMRLITGTPEERGSLWRKALFIVLLVIAFGCRFTAPLLLLYGFVLARNKTRSRMQLNRVSLLPALSVACLLAILLVLNLQAIRGKYLPDLLHFYGRSSKLAMIVNTAGVAIPSAIIPGFEMLFRNPPSANFRHPAFATSTFDLALLLLGLAVTAVIACGMWISRRRFDAEIVYVLAPLPVIGAMIQSTSRYVITYQPFYWMFAIIGAAAIWKLAFPGFSWTYRKAAVAALLLGSIGGGSLYVRSLRLTPGQAVSSSNFSLGSTRRRAGAVAKTFRHLRQYLETQSESETLIVAQPGATGQWKAISGLDHIYADRKIAATASRKNVLFVIWCATPQDCSAFDAYEHAVEQRIIRFAPLRFVKLFDESQPYAKARVYRILPGGDAGVPRTL